MSRRREPERPWEPSQAIVFDLSPRCPVCGAMRNSKAHRKVAARCSRVRQALRLGQTLAPK